jgi:hypothetical protein
VNLAYTTTIAESKPFDLADLHYSGLKADLVSESWLERSESDVERHLTACARELMRQLLQAHVSLRAQAEPVAPVIGADGKIRTHLRRSEVRRLETTFGTIAVSRTAYSGRGATSLFPVDADLHLPKHSFSLELERLVVLGATTHSYEGTTALIERTTGADVAKRQVESITRRAAEDFHAFYDARRWVAKPNNTGGRFLVLSFDQKGVVVLHHELRDRTLKIAKNRTPRLRAVHNRDGKKHVRGRKRLAMAAAVHVIEPDHRTPQDVVTGLRRLPGSVLRKKRTVRAEDKRVWASVGQAPQEVVSEAFDEAFKRDPEQTMEWLVLVDGDPELRSWTLQAAKKRGVRVTLVLDIIHALQHLWGAGEALRGPDTQSIEDWVLPRLERLLEGDVAGVAAGMRRAATKRGLKQSQRRAIDKCADYYLKRKRMMNYKALLAAGAPIATGVIEGTCKHLIATRCDLSGARWSVAGADAVLRLRAISLSGDFDEYWKFHEEQEQLRNHTSCYSGETTPTLEPIARCQNVVRLRRHLSRRSKCATPRAA